MSLLRVAIKTKEIINDMYLESQNKMFLKLTKEQKKEAKVKFKEYIENSKFIRDKNKRRNWFDFSISALEGRGKSVIVCYECGDVFPMAKLPLLPDFHKLIRTNWLSFYATFVRNDFLTLEVEKLKNLKEKYLSNMHKD